jgi:hypothetical protein
MTKNQKKVIFVFLMFIVVVILPLIFIWFGFRHSILLRNIIRRVILVRFKQKNLLPILFF